MTRRTFLANRAHASRYLFDVEDRRMTSDRSHCVQFSLFLERFLEISNPRLRKNRLKVNRVRENEKEKRREMNDIWIAQGIFDV